MIVKARPAKVLVTIAILGVCAFAFARKPKGGLSAALRATCTAKAKEADKADSYVVPGSDGWLFLTRELRHVGVGKFWGDAAAKVSRAKPKYADPLPAIINFNAQLKKLGIDLILVPVPPKAVVYPEMICDKVKVKKGQAPPRLDVYHQEFYKLLKKKGIKVIDLMPLLLAKRLDKKGTMYCKQDTHWSGLACELTAKLIAKQIKTTDWYLGAKKVALTTKKRNVTISGDLWRAIKKDAPEKESLPLRFVGTVGMRGLTPVPPSLDSPVILLGDSHTLVFHLGGDMHTKGAGLADQLAAELLFPVDLIGVRGSGATPARMNLFRRAKKSGYIEKKKVVIWCFSAREFTESDGWRLVPVINKPGWREAGLKKK